MCYGCTMAAIALLLPALRQVAHPDAAPLIDMASTTPVPDDIGNALACL